MSEITLYFFDLFTLGEPIRIILTYFDIPFNDHRVTVEE